MAFTERNLLRVFTRDRIEDNFGKFTPLAKYQAGSVLYDSLCVGKNENEFIIAISIKDVPVGFCLTFLRSL